MADDTAADSRGGGVGLLARGQQMPRWVKIFSVVGVVLVVLFIVLHLSGYGFGGHAMHHLAH